MAKHLVIGGAGFIGCNAVKRLIGLGEEAVVADNFSRRGSTHNLAWLQSLNPKLEYHHCDVRDASDLSNLFDKCAGVDVVYHLAAQVAVTTSVTDPQTDFEINAQGTFNVLEAIRRLDSPPVLIFASTNKVYGGMEEIEIIEKDTRYDYKDYTAGIDERCPLDFHSPYGCSKGAADQYVRDYARIYDLKTVVFRQSAIFGPRQFGIEDQGWAAWFSIAALKGRAFSIYGDGKQVRDLLWVDDLADAYLKAVERIDSLSDNVFNIGGGPEHSVSIWKEFGPILEKELDRKLPVSYGDWRPGDQKVCIMNIDKVKQALDWKPSVGVEDGTAKLAAWVRDNLDIL